MLHPDGQPHALKQKISLIAGCAILSMFSLANACGFADTHSLFSAPKAAHVLLKPTQTPGAFSLHLGTASTFSTVSYCILGADEKCVSDRYLALKNWDSGSRRIFEMDGPIILNEKSANPIVKIEVFSEDTSIRKLAIEPSIGATSIDVGPQLNDYYSLTEIKTKLQSWAASAPGLLRYGVLGTPNGHQTHYLRMNAPNSYAEKKKILFFASVHGDEAIAAATLLGVTQKLLASYNTDAETRELVKDKDLYIVPVACPDGYARSSREVQNMDPNRSFPSPLQPDKRAADCVQLIKNLYDREKFDAVLDYHASGRMWLLPWGYSRTADFSDDEKDVSNLLRQLAKQMADLNGYKWGPIPRMVGYEAPGNAIDYFYIRSKELGLKTVTLGAEVGPTKRPPREGIAIEVEKNWKPFLHFIKHAPGLFEQNNGSFYSGLFDPFKELQLPVYKDVFQFFVPGKE